MKTFLNLKQYLILFAAIFSLTSCLKSDDPAYQIAATGYINQTVTEIGEGEGATITSEFEPVILLNSNYPTVSCSVSGGIMTMKEIEGTNSTAWQTASALPSSTLPKDSYTISATNADGESTPYTVSFSSITKEMEGKLKSTMSYDPETKNLTFKFEEVKNATEYLLIARASRSASLYQSYPIESYTTAGEKVLEEATFAKNLAAGNTYTLTIVAITGSSSNYGYGVVQEGASASYSKAK